MLRIIFGGHSGVYVRTISLKWETGGAEVKNGYFSMLHKRLNQLRFIKSPAVFRRVLASEVEIQSYANKFQNII